MVVAVRGRTCARARFWKVCARNVRSCKQWAALNGRNRLLGSTGGAKSREKVCAAAGDYREVVVARGPPWDVAPRLPVEVAREVVPSESTVAAAFKLSGVSSVLPNTR